MGEKADFLVQELQTNPMIASHQIERHVGSGIHRARIMLKTGKIERIGKVDIESALLAGSSRIERGLHVKIMTESCIMLCFGRHCDLHQHHCHYDFNLFLHAYITPFLAKYCSKNIKESGALYS